MQPGGAAVEPHSWHPIPLAAAVLVGWPIGEVDDGLPPGLLGFGGDVEGELVLFEALDPSQEVPLGDLHGLLPHQPLDEPPVRQLLQSDLVMRELFVPSDAHVEDAGVVVVVHVHAVADLPSPGQGVRIAVGDVQVGRVRARDVRAEQAVLLIDRPIHSPHGQGAAGVIAAIPVEVPTVAIHTPRKPRHGDGQIRVLGHKAQHSEGDAVGEQEQVTVLVAGPLVVADGLVVAGGEDLVVEGGGELPQNLLAVVVNLGDSVVIVKYQAIATQGSSTHSKPSHY
mmetsp:Transcript_54417/g.145338  ORF Transcript_54417/g.145338 Transcript_54417/m.145338 type:complete len:282 (-) Transcript_54417:193-1038(-)